MKTINFPNASQIPMIDFVEIAFNDSESLTLIPTHSEEKQHGNPR
jgi:hypothetical protein